MPSPPLGHTGDRGALARGLVGEHVVTARRDRRPVLWGDRRVIHDLVVDEIGAVVDPGYAQLAVAVVSHEVLGRSPDVLSDTHRDRVEQGVAVWERARRAGKCAAGNPDDHPVL